MKTSWLNNRARVYGILVVILLVGFGVRVWKIQVDPILGLDGDWNRTLAVNLLDGRGYTSATRPPYAQTDWRTPLSPLFVAASYVIFGRSDYPVMYLQAMVDLITCAFVFQIGRKLFGVRAGILATFLAATFVSSIAVTASLYTESLYFLLVVLFTRLLLDYPRIGKGKLFLLGLVIGLATLTRPLTILYPVFLTPLLLWLNPKKINAVYAVAVVGLGVVCVIVPWVARNKVVLDRWSLSDNAFIYINIMLGAEYEFHWAPGLQDRFALAAQGQLAPQDRIQFQNDTLAAFRARVEREGWLGYVRVRVLQVAAMWFYPGVDFFLHDAKEIPLSQAIAERDVESLGVRAACLVLWGILPFLLTVIALPGALKQTPATLFLLVFGIFITIPNLILVTDWRYAAPSFFLQAPLMGLGLVRLGEYGARVLGRGARNPETRLA